MLDSGAPIELFGLDVTSQAVMTPAWIESLGGPGRGRCSQAADRMLKAYALADPLPHDACPVARLLNPLLFSGKVQTLAVHWSEDAQEGRVLASAPGGDPRPDGRGQAEVLYQVDTAGLMQLVFERITLLDK